MSESTAQAGSGGPLSGVERERVRAFIATQVAEGEHVAMRAHGRLEGAAGLRLSYPSFMRYWREAVEGGSGAPGSAPSLVDVARGKVSAADYSAAHRAAGRSDDAEGEPKIIHFPGGPVEIPSSDEQRPRRRKVSERVEISGAAGSFSAEPCSDGRWKVQIDMHVSRSVALQMMGQSTALLLPQESK